ncbi:MAG: hypothetical protein ACRDUA_05650, partial [Micromonosporaceae bacterium]
RMPIDVPREPISEETPSASAKLGAVTSASQPAECASRLPLGASDDPDRTVAAVAVIAKAAP